MIEHLGEEFVDLNCRVGIRTEAVCNAYGMAAHFERGRLLNQARTFASEIEAAPKDSARRKWALRMQAHCAERIRDLGEAMKSAGWTVTR